jgi:hypothetical protein
VRHFLTVLEIAIRDSKNVFLLFDLFGLLLVVFFGLWQAGFRMCARACALGACVFSGKGSV